MDIFQYAFMQKALLAGVFLALSTGFISFFVVNKDLSFIGTGIAHILFGGLALGILTGLPPFLCGAVFALLSAFGIAAFSWNKKISANIFIGIFLSLSMALGILFIKLQSSNIDVFSYLFGSILGISSTELLLFGSLSLFLITFFLFNLKNLLLSIFDPMYGQAIKAPVLFFHYALLLGIALAIVFMVRIVGVIMVEGLLIFPGISAYYIAKNYRQQIVFALLFAFISIFGGIFLSASGLKLPAGPAIILSAFVIFVICYALKKR